MTCKDGRFNTGNKLCSNDLRDLNDNSIIVDGYVNSEELYIEDRLGVERLTLAGIQNKSDKQHDDIQERADTQNTAITDRADSTISKFEGEIDAIIKEAGGIEVVNEWSDSLESPPSVGFMRRAISYITPEYFGAKGNRSSLSSVYSDLTDARKAYPLTAHLITTMELSIDWCAVQEALFTGGAVYLQEKAYYLNNTLEIPKGSYLQGAGKGVWDLPSHSYATRSTKGASCLMFFGEPVRKVKVEGVTSCELTGGVVTNPDSISSTDKVYRLTNFYNEDASANKPATAKELNVAVLATDSQDSVIRDTMILKSYNGIGGYNDPALTGLGDNYDIGVILRNSSNVLLENNNIVGYWKMLGLAVVSGHLGETQGNSVQNRVVNTYVQGGTAVRSPDVLPILKVNGKVITVPFSRSSFLSEGKVVINSIVYSYSLGGYSTDTVDMVLDKAGNYKIGNEVRVNTTNVGHGGTVFDKCVLMGLFHTSRRSADSLGLKQDTSLEMSGFPLRNIKVVDSYILSSEVLLHLHDTEDIYFKGNQLEAYGSKNSQGVWNDSGARVIVSGKSTEGFGKYSIEGSKYVYFDDSNVYSAYTIDFHPYSRDSRLARFKSSTGLFRPIYRYLGGSGSGVISPIPPSSKGTVLATTGIKGQEELTVNGNGGVEIISIAGDGKSMNTNIKEVFLGDKSTTNNNWNRLVGYGKSGATYTILYNDNPDSLMICRWGGGASAHSPVNSHVFYTTYGNMLELLDDKIKVNLKTFNDNSEAVAELGKSCMYKTPDGDVRVTV